MSDQMPQNRCPKASAKHSHLKLNCLQKSEFLKLPSFTHSYCSHSYCLICDKVLFNTCFRLVTRTFKNASAQKQQIGSPIPRHIREHTTTHLKKGQRQNSR
jgi:hypothetical protein